MSKPLAMANSRAKSMACCRSTLIPALACGSVLTLIRMPARQASGERSTKTVHSRFARRDISLSNSMVLSKVTLRLGAQHTEISVIREIRGLFFATNFTEQQPQPQKLTTENRENTEKI